MLVNDPHWLNIVPDSGSLIVPVVPETGQPSPVYPRMHKLTDGRLLTTTQICNASDNIHKVPAPTLRRRLHLLNIRDPKELWAPPMETGKRLHKREKVA